MSKIVSTQIDETWKRKEHGILTCYLYLKVMVLVLDLVDEHLTDMTSKKKEVATQEGFKIVDKNHDCCRQK